MSDEDEVSEYIDDSDRSGPSEKGKRVQRKLESVLEPNNRARPSVTDNHNNAYLPTDLALACQVLLTVASRRPLRASRTTHPPNRKERQNVADIRIPRKRKLRRC